MMYKKFVDFPKIPEYAQFKKSFTSEQVDERIFVGSECTDFFQSSFTKEDFGRKLRENIEELRIAAAIL